MNKRLPLSHNEAVKEVYRLVPQLKEYDEFMYLGVRWVPYTMFSHWKNYSSDVINTDEFGFRYGLDEFKRRVSVADFDNNKPVNLLIGGSTSLGTGTTNDNFTISSNLSEYTGETWLNLGIRGFNATQELIQFMMHQHRFNKINNIVILSGINTLTLEGLPDEYASEHGRYYYSYEFMHYMDKYNHDISRRQNSYASGINGKKTIIERFRYFLESLSSPNPAEKVLTDKNIDTQQRIIRAAWYTIDALRQFKALLSARGTKLTFALQPIATWTKHELTEEEKDIFHAIDYCPNNWWRLFEKVCTSDTHKLFSFEISKECANLEINFCDINTMLRNSDAIKDTFYVDHVHFNDKGYDEVSKLIYGVINNIN
ncbi:MAG: hypothetical protein ACK5WP_09335 [Neisseriaceae bacterium]